MANRLITISIRKYLVTQPRTKRARKAVRYVRERIAHYTKLSSESVKLSPELSALIVKRHARSMMPVRASVSIEKGIANVSPLKEAQDGAGKADAAAEAKPVKKSEVRKAKAADTGKGPQTATPAPKA